MPRRSSSDLPKKLPDGRSYVYAMTSDGETHKIGHTRDIRSRLRTLQTSLQEELTLTDFMVVEKLQAVHLERKLHREYNYLKTRGEWFRMDCAFIRRLFAFARIRWAEDGTLDFQ